MIRSRCIDHKAPHQGLAKIEEFQQAYVSAYAEKIFDNWQHNRYQCHNKKTRCNGKENPGWCRLCKEIRCQKEYNSGRYYIYHADIKPSSYKSGPFFTPDDTESRSETSNENINRDIRIMEPYSGNKTDHERKHKGRVKIEDKCHKHRTDRYRCAEHGRHAVRKTEPLTHTVVQILEYSSGQQRCNKQEPEKKDHLLLIYKGRLVSLNVFEKNEIHDNRHKETAHKETRVQLFLDNKRRQESKATQEGYASGLRSIFFFQRGKQ